MGLKLLKLKYMKRNLKFKNGVVPEPPSFNTQIDGGDLRTENPTGRMEAGGFIMFSKQKSKCGQK